MSDSNTVPGATPSRWWNPWFLLVFVPGAAAWVAVVGWFTWRYFNPVTDWIGRQNEILQELLGPLCFVAWAVVLSVGLGGIGALAELTAGIPRVAPPGQTHGRHSKWTPPGRG